MACTTKIAQAIARNCATPNQMGLEQEILLINHADLLKANIDLNSSTPNSLIDDITLNSGTQGYMLEGFKKMIRYNNTFVGSQETSNGVIHTLENIPWYDQSAAGLNELSKLQDGARVYVVVKRIFQGVDQESAFRFFGYDYGLELTDFVEASNENDGVPLITLGTPDGFKEQYLPRILLDTDFATTNTAFAAFFAEA
jgi:hypothetical protein